MPNLLRGLRSLAQRALAEHSSPREVGLAVGLGTFCACTPLIGFHLWMALGLATLLGLNRVWAAVGSRATTVPVLFLVVFSEIQLAHRVRTGAWVPLSPREILAHGRELPFDWWLGTPLVGGAYAVVLGTVAYVLARRRQGALTQRTPVGPLPGSSGSLPSERPTPSP
jgi:uncharacterized protein (DUF2062 family)